MADKEKNTEKPVELIYHFHPNSGLLLGSTIATYDTFEPDLKNIPAHATDIKPPEPKEGCSIFFIKGKWNHVEVIPEKVEVPEKDEPDPETVALAKRYHLLKSTDWTQVADNPMSDAMKSAFREYRQALRDITKQKGYPKKIKWPEAPKTE
jgi:hypothetical protein